MVELDMYDWIVIQKGVLSLTARSSNLYRAEIYGEL